MSPPIWPPFCTRMPNYEHDTHCQDQVACGYCGQANPNYLASSTINPISPSPVIVIEDDTPPRAHPTAIQVSSLTTPTSIQRSSQVSTPQAAGQLHQNQKEVRQHRNLAIQRTQNKDGIPNAGSQIQRVRPMKTVISRDTISLEILPYQAIMKNIKLRTYGKWDPTGGYRIELPVQQVFEDKEDFINIVKKKVDNVGSMIDENIDDIFEIIIAASVGKNGPQGIPSADIWAGLNLLDILRRCFNATSPSGTSARPYYNVYICIGHRMEDDFDNDKETDVLIPQPTAKPPSSMKTTSKSETKIKAEPKTKAESKIKVEKTNTKHIKKEPKSQQKKHTHPSQQGSIEVVDMTSTPLGRKRSFSDLRSSTVRMSREYLTTGLDIGEEVEMSTEEADRLLAERLDREIAEEEASRNQIAQDDHRDHDSEDDGEDNYNDKDGGDSENGQASNVLDAPAGRTRKRQR